MANLENSFGTIYTGCPKNNRRQINTIKLQKCEDLSKELRLLCLMKKDIALLKSLEHARFFIFMVVFKKLI